MGLTMVLQMQAKCRLMAGLPCTGGGPDCRHVRVHVPRLQPCRPDPDDRPACPAGEHAHAGSGCSSAHGEGLPAQLQQLHFQESCQDNIKWGSSSRAMAVAAGPWQ